MTVEYSNPNETHLSPLLGRKDECPAKTPLSRMVFFVFIVSLPYFVSGFCLVFSSIALPRMQVNIDEASWYGSIPALGFLLSSACIGFIMDRFGRKVTLLMNVLPAIIGWFLLSREVALPIQFLGRFLTGFCSPYVGQVYIAETIAVNDHHLRSSFITWAAVGVSAGGLTTYVLARILPHYQNIALVASFISAVTFVVTLVIVPESPQWLYDRGRVTEAYVAEERLRIRQPSLQNIQQGGNSELRALDWRHWLRKLKRKDVYKPTIISTVWLVLTNFNGAPALRAYLLEIISTPVIGRPSENAAFKSSDYDSSIVGSVLILIGSILMTSLIGRTGIKRLYIFSSTGAALGMITLAISFQLMKTEKSDQFWNEAHVLAVWMVQFFQSIGVDFIPVLILGEIYPSDARGFASIGSFSFALFGGLAIKLHLYLYDCLDALIYFVYAGVTVLGIGFMHFFVQETVGKSLEEIGLTFRDELTG